MKYVLCGVLLLLSVKVGAQQEKSFARVALYPNMAAVTLDKGVEADQIIVTVFYRDNTSVPGTELLRSITDVQPAVPGVGVAIRSVIDPASVQSVRIELVKNAGKMEWKP